MFIELDLDLQDRLRHSSKMFWWLGAIVAVFFGRIVFWTEPYGISVDESTYLAIAEAWDHYGGLYIHSIDRKPPLLYALYWLIGKVFGFWNIHGPHLVAIAATLLICWIIDKTVRQRFENVPKGFAAFLYAVISGTFSREFISSNSELYLLIPLSLGFLSLAIAKEKESTVLFWFFAFMGAALSSFFKQTGIIVLMASASAACVYVLYHRAPLAVLRIFLGCFLGGLLATLVCLGPFWASGTLSDMIHWSVTDNFTYVKDASHLKTSRPIFSPFFISLAVWPLFWAASLYFIYISRRQIWTWILAGGLLGGLAFVSVGGRLYSHYFVPLSFVLVLTSASTLYSWLLKRPRLVMVGILVPFLVCFALVTFRDSFAPYLKTSFPDTMIQRITRASDYIKQNSTDHDRIAVWGMASQFYVLSERGSGTRFIPADYASGRLAGFASGTKVISAANMKSYLDDIRTKQPLYFVDTSSANLNDYGNFPIQDYPDLQQLLSLSYEKITNVEGFDLWRRRSTANVEERAP